MTRKGKEANIKTHKVKTKERVYFVESVHLNSKVFTDIEDVKPLVWCDFCRYYVPEDETEGHEKGCTECN